MYCIVARGTSARVVALIERFYRHHPDVDVIVERRDVERRVRGERRGADGADGLRLERRRIRNDEGRRVGERRAMLVPVTPAAVPFGARRHLDRVTFVERLELPPECIDDLDTRRLVTRVQAREPDALHELYGRAFDQVYLYLSASLEDPAEAVEGLHEVFAIALHEIEDYDVTTLSFRAWLFGIVHCVAGLPNDDVEADSPVSGSMAPGGRDVLGWLNDQELAFLVHRVPRPQRQVLLLRYMVGLSTHEIADIVGCSPASARDLQAAGFEFIQDRLAALGRRPRDRSRFSMSRLPGPDRVLRSRRLALSGH